MIEYYSERQNICRLQSANLPTATVSEYAGGQNLIEKTVCFSGHRPEKLPGRGKCDSAETEFIMNLLRSKIEESISEGYTRFLSGVARGIDLWAARTVLELKKKNPGIELVCVKPVSNQGENFPEEDKKLYEAVISEADRVICTSESYSRNCYTVRNHYMVDNASKLIAFVNSYRSGTGQTIRYARKLGRKTDITELSAIDFSMKYEQLEF